MKMTYWGAAVLLSLLASCSVYKAAPIDLARDTQAWRTLSRNLCAGSCPLDRTTRHRIGLQLNPELNKARLTKARSASLSRYAGLWEDPSLSLEGQRVLSDGVLNGGLTPSLALPLSGLPRLAKKVAEQYDEAEYWNVLAQERSYLAKQDALSYRIMLEHRRQELMQQRMAALTDEKNRMERLFGLGEISFAEYQTCLQRWQEMEKAKQEQDNEHLKLHLELVQLLGLHPDFSNLEIVDSLPATLPAAVAIPSASALLESPALRSQLASYGASETELRAEIRKQYPALSLSPSFSREEEANRLGIGVELSLPLWNRNREAIAKATGDRSLKQAESVQLWRSLLSSADALRQRQELALAHCRAEQERVQRLAEAEQQQEKLFSLGESSLPELSEARHEIYQRRLNYMDCLAQLLEIQTELQYLNPDFQ